MDCSRRSHKVIYECRYHIVVCLTYRRGVVPSPIDERLKTILLEQTARWGQELIEREVMPDAVVPVRQKR